ncbi:MAG: Hsp20/alpha crystallin family protein [Burkholderiales bacterium]|nr:MAG: Hsp20/alpha crystallin family protein [Burkholderiales bacterium]
MADITRWNPFRDLSRFDPFDIEQMFRQMGMPRALGLGEEMEPKLIRLDVSEDDKAYTVRAELPGVKKEDIDVKIDGNQVSISAEVKRDKEEKDQKGRVVRSERYYGSVHRSFALASDIDSAAAEASCENGVLKLVLPKKSGSQARKLSVA